MMRRQPIRLTLCVFSISFGCDTTVVVPSSPSNVAHEDTYAADVAKRYCDAHARCCSDDVDTDDVISRCRSAVADEFSTYIRLNQQRDMRAFETDRASSCLQALEALKCPEDGSWREPMIACKDVYMGTQEEGDWCTSPLQCKYQRGQSYSCSLRNGCQLGSFYEHHALGESCAGSPLCDNGTYCASGTCEPWKVAGEECADASECESRWCRDNTCMEVNSCEIFLQ